MLGTPAGGAGAVLALHYRERAEHLDAVLARRDDELRVIAAFLAELAPR